MARRKRDLEEFRNSRNVWIVYDKKIVLGEWRENLFVH